MKTLRTLIVIALAVFFAGQGFAQDATAPTITFNVPLQLNNLHQDVLEVRASACCYDQAGAPVVLTGNSPSIRPDANGNVNQTVTIVVSALAGKDIANAKTYAVSIGLKVEGSTVFTTPRAGAGASIALQPKSGTTLVSQVTGNIVW